MNDIQGVYAANVTPFNDAGTINLDAYLRHVHWLLQRGISGLVPFGTNGEGPSISIREKKQVLKALFQAHPNTPIIPAVMQSNLPDVLELIEFLNDQSAQAILVLPPYYYKPQAPQGQRRFYEQVLQHSTHPVIAYHIPKYAVPVHFDVVRELPLWGVKESEGNAQYAQRVLNAAKGVLLGTEDDLPGRLAAGAQGAISALANIVPAEVVACYTAVRQGRDEEAQWRSASLQGTRRHTKQFSSIALLKQLAGELQNTPFGTVRLPLTPLSAADDLSELRERITAACA